MMADAKNRTAEEKGFDIPDHEIIRQIGRGSYGDVWLGKSLTGTFRAIKVIFRDRFETDRAFSREFEGIEQFEPISRAHPNLVQVLHVGRDPGSRYYFCIMELADDLKDGKALDPASYEPRTLATVTRTNGRIEVARCTDIGRQLASALAFLHDKGLVHRDVKPSNILFVGGLPKLGDIGLVARNAEASSFVGTEGYVPPEGPGSPQADMFALGKVIYEASTGKDRLDFPALPSDLASWPEKAAFMRLNEVLLCACANRPAQRHHDARQLAHSFEDASQGKRPFAPGRWRSSLPFSIGGLVLLAVVFSALVFGRTSCAPRPHSRQPAPPQTNAPGVASSNEPASFSGESPPKAAHSVGPQDDMVTSGVTITEGEVSSNGIPTKTTVTEDAAYFLRP